MMSRKSGWFDGPLPRDWDTTLLRAAFIEQTERSGEVFDDYLSLTANAGVIPYAEKGAMGNKAPEDMSKCKKVSIGDFVLNSMNFGIGSFGVSKYNGVCSSVYLVLQPSGDLFNSSFLQRIFELPGFQKHAQSLGNGILAHRAAFGWDKLRTIQVPLPPRAQQDSIAKYLDHELAKIDLLISKNEELLNLSEIRKRTLISDVLMKGLKEGISTKPTGLPWGGECPEHWQVRPLWSVAKPTKLSNRGMVEDNLLSLSYGEVVERDIESAEGLLPASFETYQIVVPGNAVFRLTDLQNDKKSLRSAIVKTRGIITSAYLSLELSAEFDPEFFGSLMRSYDLQKVFYSMGSGLRQSLNWDEFKGLPVLMPPLAEQIEIKTHLEDVSAKAKALALKLKEMNEVLQLRRTSLIQSVVTGKMPVEVS
jgi:type I restriction enzyme S subunit